MKQIVQYWYSGIRWYFNGNLHRDKDLPARYYFEGGKLIIVFYYQHNKLHRATGPAIINYDNKIKRYFYQNREYASLEKMLMMEACR